METPDHYFRELRKKLIDSDQRRQFELETAYQRMLAQQSRRVRECWTEQDDYLFNAGYLAWEATGER